MRWFIALTAVGLLCGADGDDSRLIDRLSQEAPRDKSIRRALTFLRSLQQPDGDVGVEFPTAATALAVMAHLTAGHTPDDPQYGPWLCRSIDFVLLQQEDNGYFGQKDNSRMYGHGICTLALAETLGMCRDDELDERIRAALEKAVAVTVNAARIQKDLPHTGGWRYQPTEDASDLSLSGWQLMSLHATAQVGIQVPEEVITGAVEYAKRLTSADGKVAYESPGQDNIALRGTALLSIAIGGNDEAPELARIAERIVAQPITWQGDWFFYRAYYDAVGLSRATPQVWETYAETLEPILIEHQSEDGSWPTPPGDNEGDYGVVYRTCMAVLALGVEKHLLPAYQR